MCKKFKDFAWVIVIVSSLLAIGAAIGSFFVIKEKKKKDEKELEEYLDYSIL